MSGFMVKAALAPLAATKRNVAKSAKVAVAKANKRPTAGMKQLRAVQSLLPGVSTGAKRAAVSPRIPDGAQYLTRRHRSVAGSRGYKIYLPASEPKRPRGLILMLHGCSQTADDFAVGTHINTLAEKHGLAIAYPEQTKMNNLKLCWNWFKPGNQQRGLGEPAILATLTQKLMKEFGLERDAVFVAGLSAGGAMAAILADVYPEIYSAAGIHSGLTRGSAHSVLTAMAAMRKGGVSEGIVSTIAEDSLPVRRIIFQGDSDSTVHPSNAAMIVAAAVGSDAVPSRIGKRTVRERGYARSDYSGSDGAILLEFWMIEGSGHAWSGGRAAGSYTDRKGPDASVQMIRFFLAESATCQ